MNVPARSVPSIRLNRSFIDQVHPPTRPNRWPQPGQLRVVDDRGGAVDEIRYDAVAGRAAFVEAALGWRGTPFGSGRYAKGPTQILARSSLSTSAMPVRTCAPSAPVKEDFYRERNYRGTLL